MEDQFAKLDERLRKGEAAAAGADIAPFDLVVEGQAERVLPVAGHALSRAEFPERLRLVPETEAEAAGRAPCSFLNEAGFASDCAEAGAQRLRPLIRKYVKGDDAVLEVGARYGAGTCAAAEATGNSGRVVAVEPDEAVWAPLLWNRHSHHCASWLFRGVVADRDLAPPTPEERGRAKLVGAAAAAAGAGARGARPHLTYSELQAATGLNFTAIVVDCFGCVDSLFRGNRGSLCELLSGVRTVVLRGDVSADDPGCRAGCVDYSLWEALFSALGFGTEEKQSWDFAPGQHAFVFVRFKWDQACGDPAVVAAERAVLAENAPPPVAAEKGVKWGKGGEEEAGGKKAGRKAAAGGGGASAGALAAAEQGAAPAAAALKAAVKAPPPPPWKPLPGASTSKELPLGALVSQFSTAQPPLGAVLGPQEKEEGGAG